VRSLPVLPAILLVGASLLAACGGDVSGSKPAPEPPIALRAVTSSVPVGEMAVFVKPGGGLSSASHPGKLGSVGVTFGALDDSTLTVLVPASVAPGSVLASVDIGGGKTGEARFSVSPGVTVADPAAKVAAALEEASAVVRVPRPAGYGAAWSADSAVVERAISDARAAFAQLGPDDQLEMARTFGSLTFGGAASRAPAHAAGSLTSADAVQDAKCAQELVGWESQLGAGEQAAGAAAAVRFNPLKWAVAKAFAITTYIKGVLTVGQVGVICTMEQNFDVAGTATADEMGTAVSVRADHRTFVDTDAAQNAVAAAVQRARTRTRALFTAIRSLFGGEGTVSGPDEVPAGAVVREDVWVEGERVALATTEVEGTGGSRVGLTLVRSAGQVIVRATGDLRAAVVRQVRFTVTRPNYAPQTVTADVVIQSVCMEEGQLFPGCVDRVAVTPREVSIGLGNTEQLKATAYDAQGKELAREISWWSADESVVQVGPQSGIVRGDAVGGPVTITASAGRGPNRREGTASVTVTAVDSTEIYAEAALGRWGVTLLESSSSYTLELRPGGKGAYLVAPDSYGYCPGHGGTRVGDSCEYPNQWSITRSGGRYFLWESGFFHPAYGGEPRDPLTYPITGFTTYSNFNNSTPSRRYVKQ